MKRKIFNCTLGIFIASMFAISANAQIEKLTIIGNLESVPSQMTYDQLRTVFKGERLRWVDGTKVKLALMKTTTPIGLATSEKLFNMTANELNKYFLALVFQGKIKAPSFFNSARELEEFVGQTPGAIGIIQTNEDDRVKIVIVDGKQEI